MDQSLVTVGWREWVLLPDLGLPWIKAKVDTGAKTSCLHASYVTTFTLNDELWVRFGMHPNQDETETIVHCEAKVTDERTVTDSGGHSEMRYVITTEFNLGNIKADIELTLTNRDNMRYRMLLGRRAMVKKMIVDPDKSYLVGTPETISTHLNDVDTEIEEY